MGTFVAPFAVATGLFLVVPTLYGLWMSFTNQSLTGTGSEFIGFANYAEAFSDPQVWQTLWHTVWFTILSTVPLVLGALVMALLVHTGLLSRVEGEAQLAAILAREVAHLTRRH